MAVESRGCKGRPQLLDQWSVQESSSGKSNYETTEERNLELKASNNSNSSNLGSSSCRQKERTAYRGQVGALSGRTSRRTAVCCELHAAVAAAAPSQGSGRSSPAAIHAELVDCEENLRSSLSCSMYSKMSEEQLCWLNVAASAPAVGWPPIRSFRKNLAGGVKASAESPGGSSEAVKKLVNDKKSSFVKINMNGIPVGRKIDPKAYDSYEKLSLPVDELFRGLMTGTLQTSLFDMHKYGLIS
ncbi:unnamed protein product [Musa banksii]